MTFRKRTDREICAWMIRLSVLLVLAGCGGGGGSSNSVCSGSPGTGAPLTITGHLQYEDKTFDQNGFTGATPVKPIRFATVQVVRSCDNTTVLNSADSVSDVNGDYSITFTNTGPAGVYVRVLASAPARQISIKTPPDTPPVSLWAISSDPIDDTGASPFTMDVTATTTTGGGIFNLLDVTTSAAEFVDGLTGSAMPALTVYWDADSCDGTFFNPGDNSIHVLGGCTDGDTDEYDDAVVTHEFGHFAAAVYSRDDSPGGQHFLNDNTQDMRLTWSEGWGDFFSSAARNDPLYVDTVGLSSTAAANLSFNLEDLTTVTGILLAADAVYSTNEISVAAVLWDIFDNTPAENYTVGADAVSAGMAPIWDVITNYFTCPDCGISNVSFEDFWDGWFNCPACIPVDHGSATEMAAVIADREILFKLDSLDSPVRDDDAPSASNCPSLPCTTGHTLFPAGDLDVVSFAATSGIQYTIVTSRLTNGADTFLEVLEPDGSTVLKSNDDATPVTKSSGCGVNLITQSSNCPPNDATTLSSKVVFTPSAGGTYYVRVSRSAAAPPSAGVYGSYDLKIISP